LKTNGKFKFAGVLNLKLRKKPATPAKKGVNPFTTVATSRPPASTPGAAGLSERRRSLCLLGLLFWAHFIVCALALPLCVPVAFGLSGCDELIVIYHYSLVPARWCVGGCCYCPVDVLYAFLGSFFGLISLRSSGNSLCVPGAFGHSEWRRTYRSLGSLRPSLSGPSSLVRRR